MTSCPYPQTNPPACNRTVADSFGSSYSAFWALTTVIAAAALLVGLVHLARLRRDGELPGSLARLRADRWRLKPSASISLVAVLTLLLGVVRTVDFMGYRGVLPLLLTTNLTTMSVTLLGLCGIELFATFADLLSTTLDQRHGGLRAQQRFAIALCRAGLLAAGVTLVAVESTSSPRKTNAAATAFQIMITVLSLLLCVQVARGVNLMRTAAARLQSLSVHSMTREQRYARFVFAKAAWLRAVSLVVGTAVVVAAVASVATRSESDSSKELNPAPRASNGGAALITRAWINHEVAILVGLGFVAVFWHRFDGPSKGAAGRSTVATPSAAVSQPESPVMAQPVSAGDDVL